MTPPSTLYRPWAPPLDVPPLPPLSDLVVLSEVRPIADGTQTYVVAVIDTGCDEGEHDRVCDYLRKISDPFQATEFLVFPIIFVHPTECYVPMSPPSLPSPPLPPPFPPNPPGMPPAAPGCVLLYPVTVDEEISDFDRGLYTLYLAGYLVINPSTCTPQLPPAAHDARPLPAA